MFVKPHKMCLVPDFFLLPLTHLKFPIHSHYSQEKPIAGQPEYQGLYSSLFGVVIICCVEIVIDASKLVKNVFPISDYNSKVLKNAQICFYPPFMLSLTVASTPSPASLCGTHLYLP